MIWGFAAALAGMLLYGVASVSQAYAASRASGSAVLRHPAYVLGMAGDGLAWVCSIAALATLPLFVVQSMLAGAVAVTVLLALAVLHVPVTRRDLIGVAAVVSGLTLVSAAAGGESTAAAPGWFGAAMIGAVVAMIVLGAVLYVRGTSLALASVGGLAFSGSALGARGAHLGQGTLTSAVSNPLTWAVIAFGILGAVTYARSLERGPVGAATAAMWVVEVVVPGALGVALLGDSVRPGWAPAAVAGIALAVLGCLRLSRSAAHESPPA